MCCRAGGGYLVRGVGQNVRLNPPPFLEFLSPPDAFSEQFNKSTEKKMNEDKIGSYTVNLFWVKIVTSILLLILFVSRFTMLVCGLIRWPI